MTEKIQYPKEIFKETEYDENGCPLWNMGDYVRRSYRIGLRDGKQAAQADQLAGFSNLTKAIQDGTRIDWERLDGRVAKCVHPDRGTLTGEINRDYNYDLGTPASMYNCKGDPWGQAVHTAFIGHFGWSLWVEGEIPIKTRTADELEPGTCFKGSYHGNLVNRAQVIANEYGRRLVTDCDTPGIGGYEETEVEVIEVYGVGTFQATKEKA